MNQRYVDDINVAARATVPGLRYVDGKIIMDILLPRLRRTRNELQTKGLWNC